MAILNKSTLLIITIFLTIISKSQVYNLTYRGEKLNYIDSNGVKQGKWIEFRQNDTNNTLNYKTGNYNEGMKSGKWEIHTWYYDYGGVYFINYSDNGWYTVELQRYKGWNFRIDSSIIYKSYFIEKTEVIKSIAFKDGNGNYELIVYDKSGLIKSRKSNISFDFLGF